MAAGPMAGCLVVTTAIEGTIMLAYDYPLLGVFWTVVFISFWVAALFLLFWIVADIFRSQDMGGVAKALWLLVVLLVPFLGSVAYVVFREHLRSERQFREAA